MYRIRFWLRVQRLVGDLVPIPQNNGALPYLKGEEEWRPGKQSIGWDSWHGSHVGL